MLRLVKAAIRNYIVYEETVLKFITHTGLPREEVNKIAEESRKIAMSKTAYLESELYKRLNPQK